MNANIGNTWNRGDKSPVIYRAASRGKAMTRHEKILDLEFKKARQAVRNERKEMILAEKRKIADAKEKRAKVMAGITFRLETNDSLRRDKDGKVFIQPRSKGKFLPKVTL